MSRKRRTITALAAVTTLTAGGLGVTLLPGSVPGVTTVAAAAELTPYDDCGELLQAYRSQLYKAATAYGLGGGYGRDLAFAAGGSALATSEDATRSAAPQAVGSSSTGTNVQEAGVDEPDTAKLAGNVLLVSSGNTVQLVKPGPTPKVLSVVQLGKDVYGAQLLVDGNRVLALTQDQPHGIMIDSGFGGRSIGPGYSRTKATLIDISRPASPRVLETTTTDGHLVSARLSDGRVRLVTSSSPRLAAGTFPKDGTRAEFRRALLANRAAAKRVTLAQVLPQTEHRNGAGAVRHRGPAVACEDVSYPKGAAGMTTLTVTSLDLAGTLAPTGSVAVNADGDLAYMSAETLYVATSRWGITSPGLRAAGNPDEVSTQLHAFALDGPTARYRGTGSVPGYLLNSYSLSEHDGHLRAATTRQAPWANTRTEQRSSASVIILKDDGKGALVHTGRIDGLGKGERIYAVRYLGDVATVVTFRQTDPLYTLDLADPTAPKVLGELKIPGFSNYLHPIGDDTLVGVGHSADAQGRVTGLQLATFDLSDLAAPRRTRTLPLGVGYSEATHEAHAFSYSPELQLLTIPMSDHQGKSFLVGARASAGQLVEVGRLASPNGSHASRTIVVGSLLMVISDNGVTAADIRNLAPAGSVTFKR